MYDQGAAACSRYSSVGPVVSENAVGSAAVGHETLVPNRDRDGQRRTDPALPTPAAPSGSSSGASRPGNTWQKNAALSSRCCCLPSGLHRERTLYPFAALVQPTMSKTAAADVTALSAFPSSCRSIRTPTRPDPPACAVPSTRNGPTLPC